MSLYGALFAGVSGIDAQSNSLGIISNNISNANTVGYKQVQSEFQTLVTGVSSSSSAFAPGGVLAGNRQLVDQQGLLQSTSSPTDIAIQGSGLFVVNQTATGSGQVLYTRAGSFTQDANGNFVNTAGYFLQAWPLDSSGNLPGSPGNKTNTTSSANLSSLVTVNAQNVTGSATPTTSVSLSANINANQAAAVGAGATASMDANDAVNFGINANELIAQTNVDHLTRGDKFTITTTGAATVNAKFEYGGFSIGRDVANDIAGSGVVGGDAATALPDNTPKALSNAPNPVQTAGSGSGDVTIALNNAGTTYGLTVGSEVTLAGLNTVGGITAGQLTGKFIITAMPDNDHFTITTSGSDPAVGGTAGGGNTGTAVVRLFAGNILDATSAGGTFLGTTGTSSFLNSALSFTISTAASGTVTFTYTASAPNPLLGQFNNLTNLATAINDVTGMTARVVGGQLYVGPADANARITFANGAVAGSSGPPVLAGIDWVNELGLADVASNNPFAVGGFNRFSTLQSLANDVNSISGLTATVTNPTGSSTLTIDVADPLGTITFADSNTNTGSPLAELGIGGSLHGGAFAAETVGPLGPAYSPTTAGKNMASGAIPAQFSRPVTVYDALGAAHNLNIAFLKTASNTWAVEIFAQPGTDVTTASSLDGTADGLVAYGTLTFNGDGTINKVTGSINSLTQPITINWTNGANSSAISFNWGTLNKTDGLSQFASGYNVNSVNQNGTPVGQLTGVSIDSNGFITASFNNGQTQKLYKIPLAGFANPDQLQSVTGDAYAQTSGSGIVNLKQAGQSGVGTISSSSLEQSNVELADQLTSMIVAQRAYQANTKEISTADQLLNDLDQIIQ
jgi:flagellar hook protein FlgE